MSRLFDGVDDVYIYAVPASGTGPVNLTFGTSLIVCRYVTAPSWASMIEIYDGSNNPAFATGRHSGGGMYFTDNATLRHSQEAGTTQFTIVTGDNWCVYAVTKATGTQPAVMHKVPLATGTRTTYTPTTNSTNCASIASGTIKIAGDDDWGNIRVAAAAVMPGVVLTTTQIDAIVTAKTTQSIIDVAGADGWVVDDSDGLTNNLVASNTNRSSIGGAPADDADDPAGWTYFGAGAAAASPIRRRRRPPRGLTIR